LENDNVIKDWLIREFIDSDQKIAMVQILAAGTLLLWHTSLASAWTTPEGKWLLRIRAGIQTTPINGQRLKLEHKTASHMTALYGNVVDDDDNNDSRSEKSNPLTASSSAERDEEFDIDVFLDTPFFDPQQILDDETSNSMLRRLASFIQNDYETAEIVMAGIMFVVLIIASQEMLRIQYYGWDNYVPFTKGINPGRLF
jgi:hypothetical protein